MLLAALCSTSCRTKQVSVRTEEIRTQIEQQKVDSIHEQVLVVVYDTVRVVTTITVQVNETGDTLRTDRITDRSSGQLRVESGLLTVFSNERQALSDTVIIHDSVFIVKAPVSDSSTMGNKKNRSINSTLFWIFAIICAFGGVVFLIKLKSEILWRK